MVLFSHMLYPPLTTLQSSVNCLAFHPRLPLILSGGPASTIYLHQIDPSALEPNPLLTSLHIRNTPLTTTSFLSPTGNQIFLSSRRRYFHVWSLESGRVVKVTRVYGHQHEQKSMERFKLSPCGRYMGLIGSSKKGGGYINILSADSLQWIVQVRVEGRGGCADFEWWADGNGITTISVSGEVGEWSIESRSFVSRWRDEGNINATVLSLGGLRQDREISDVGPDRWIAIGSSSGYVNVYDRTGWKAGLISTNPKPGRAFEQLVTSISSIKISPDGQLLAIASKWKRDALRLSKLLIF
jgi:U3 small nucleolar RNA-associated protein 18